MLKSIPILITLALAASAGHAADNCEPLRAKIEANIATKGSADFTVSTVDAAATVPGQVVGSCDNGAKKIVYARGSGPVRPATPPPAVQALATAAVPRPAAQPKVAKRSTREEDILTECKDGSVSMGGNCKN